MENGGIIILLCHSPSSGTFVPPVTSRSNECVTSDGHAAGNDGAATCVYTLEPQRLGGGVDKRRAPGFYPEGEGRGC